jgi:heme/copper-type cytochrome/quinol oxidase subunit 4
MSPFHRHAREGRFEELDRGFGHMVVVGYLIGFVSVFVLMLALLTAMASGVPEWGDVFASLGVAVQAGILGSVLAVGPWSDRHKHDLYG